MKEIVMQQSVSLFHNNIVVWRELVDTLLNGVPSDDPFLLIFFLFLTFCFSFLCFVVNGRDVLSVNGNNKMFVSLISQVEKTFAAQLFAGIIFCENFFRGGNFSLQIMKIKKKRKSQKLQPKTFSATRYLSRLQLTLQSLNHCPKLT